MSHPVCTPATAPAEGPLAGVTVLDMTRVLAGPYCTMLLADLGARVIKVELPVTGDDARRFGPFTGDKSAYFMSLNRGKESIALNLKTPNDRKIFERLLDRADILIENFRPGKLAKLGYGWDVLHQRYPRLIYGAISGFGQTGPYRDRPSYDLIAQAMGGLMSLTGHPGDSPVRAGISIGDTAAGLFAAVGLIGALYQRCHSNRGDMVDISMLDCQVALLENALVRTQVEGTPPQPLGARHPSITPFDCFLTSDDYIVIACGNDKLFAALCTVLGVPELAQDSRYTDNQSRTVHARTLKARIEGILVTQPRKVWLDRLSAAGVPCAPIQKIDAVMDDPQVVARNMVVTATDPETGPIRIAGNPIKMAHVADQTTRRPAPDLDADGDAIRAELS